MPATVAQLVDERSTLAKSITEYYKAVIANLDRTPWAHHGAEEKIRASQVAVPAQVIRQVERERRERKEREDDERLRHMDPEVAAFYEEPRRARDREEVPWARERRNLTRAVLKGAPGGGKTFLAQTTALDLAWEGLQQLESRVSELDRLPLPIMVELKKLGDNKLPGNLASALIEVLADLYPVRGPLEAWITRKVKTPDRLHQRRQYVRPQPGLPKPPQRARSHKAHVRIRIAQHRLHQQRDDFPPIRNPPVELSHRLPRRLEVPRDRHCPVYQMPPIQLVSSSCDFIHPAMQLLPHPHRLFGQRHRRQAQPVPIQVISHAHQQPEEPIHLHRVFQTSAQQDQRLPPLWQPPLLLHQQGNRDVLSRPPSHFRLPPSLIHHLVSQMFPGQVFHHRPVQEAQLLSFSPLLPRLHQQSAPHPFVPNRRGPTSYQPAPVRLRDRFGHLLVRELVNRGRTGE